MFKRLRILVHDCTKRFFFCTPHFDLVYRNCFSESPYLQSLFVLNSKPHYFRHSYKVLCLLENYHLIEQYHLIEKYHIIQHYLYIFYVILFPTFVALPKLTFFSGFSIHSIQSFFSPHFGLSGLPILLVSLISSFSCPIRHISCLILVSSPLSSFILLLPSFFCFLSPPFHFLKNDTHYDTHSLFLVLSCNFPKSSSLSFLLRFVRVR